MAWTLRREAAETAATEAWDWMAFTLSRDAAEAAATEAWDWVT